MNARPARHLAALLALALVAPANADDAAIGRAALERLQASPTLHGRLNLTLGEAIAMGLENNLDVEVQRHEPLIAEKNVGIAWGAFDPEFFADIQYVDNEIPTANPLLGAGAPGQVSLVSIRTNKSEPDGTAGIRGTIPMLGSEYSFEFSGSDLKTNNAFTVFSPEFNSGFSLSFSQPLLRDLIWNEPWTRVKTNEIVARQSNEEFRERVMDVVEQIELAYWGVVAQDDTRRVAEKSLETSEALLDQTNTQYEVGVVSKVEVVEAEAGVAEREFNLIVARNDYRNAQDVLVDLVLGRGLRAESTLEIVPTERPGDYIPYEIDVPAAVGKAFQYRPRLAAARREIERQQIQVKFARNQRLPQLDFNLSWGQQGISGQQNPNYNCFGIEDDPSTPENEVTLCAEGNLPNPIPDFSDSFDVWDDANSLTVGGTFSMPIPNRAARGTVDRTELELRRARTQTLRIEQEIVLDVRQRARNLEAAQEGIAAAERRRLAAEEQLRAERIRLEYGESTPFDVLLRERDLVEAENQKIGALQVYRNSVVELDRAQGTILRNRNVRLEDVSSLRLKVE